jgi:hypothetical protein
MKLYKADFSNQIGNKIITVPTDSQFLIGLTYSADPTATIALFDGETEIQAETDKVNAYTCFRFSTDGNPFWKPFKGVVTGTNYTKTISILVICEKMSVAYRDLEGGGGSSVDIVTEIDSESTDTEVPSAKCVYTNVTGKENASNKVTAIDSSSTDAQYPSAKCVYDIIGDVETLINAI